MATETADIFAILDVPHREDTFTSVLVHALKRSRRVREHLYSLVWPHPPRLHDENVHLRRGLGAAGIADIVIVGLDDQSRRWSLFVEVKVHAGEGPEQTKRYLAALNAAGGAPERAGGIFLTLTGHAASHERVVPLTHRALARELEAAMSDFENDAPLAIACRAYVRRASMPLPVAEASMKMSALMAAVDGLVPRLASARALGKALVERAACSGTPPLDFQALTLQGRGHASPGLQFFRASWSGSGVIGNTWTNGNVDAHIEMEIAEGVPPSLKVHFETSPYMPQSAVRKLVHADRFFAARDAFRKVVHQHAAALPDWRMTNHALQVAALKLKLAADELVGTVVETYAAQLQVIVPIVDRAVAVIEREYGPLRQAATQ